MRFFTQIRHRLESIFRPGRAERELDAELRDHYEQEVASGIQAGLTEKEAHYAARRLMGPTSLYKEECRDARRIGFWETTLRDLRYAYRTLRRAPLFSAVAILTLGLGIGANTTVFTFIDNILLRSLPVEKPERLVSLNWGGGANLSYLNYLDFRDRNHTLSGMVCYRYYPVSLSLRARENYRVWGYQTTGNYFAVLGVKPALGRFFTPDDDATDAAHPVAVISHRLWKSRFAGDPAIVGRKVKMNGFPVTIIGVAKESFVGSELIVSGDYWVPAQLEKQLEPGDGSLHFRMSQNYWALGRLKESVSERQAEANLEGIAQQIAREHPSEVNAKDHVVMAKPGLVGVAFRKPMEEVGEVLMGVAGAALLLACVNLAGMLLARASDRQKEIGIRLAVGAGRSQLVRQLLTESLVLALSGGLLGLGIAYAAFGLLRTWHLTFDIPFSTDLQPDTAVLGFTLLVALATTLVFGLVPAWQAVRTSTMNRKVRRWTIRDLLVAAQIALSVVLVISSVLVVRSLQNALSLRLGFEPEGAVSVSFDLSQSGYDRKHSRQFDAELYRKASAMPGLDAVGIVNTLPLRSGGRDGEYVSNGDKPVPAPADRRVALVYNVSPGYLRAVGTRLLFGREINEHDRTDTTRVVVVNAELARFFFGTENAVGRRVRIHTDPNDHGIEIVGVTETGKHESLGEGPTPAIYLPIEQTGTAWTTLVARTHLPPGQATDLLRKVVLDANPELTLFETGSLKEQLALPLFPARIVAILLGAFGTLAMALAATGLFALMAYAVSKRTREIGIRMALGARPQQVLQAVLMRTLVLCAAGIGVGTAITLAASHLLSAVLYGVSPRDPLTYTVALGIMAVVALLACWQPALRAIRIDPVQTLRSE